MAWLAVDRDGSEYIYNFKPIRKNDGFEYDESYYDSGYIKLPQGSIEKLIERKLSWSDEPVEI